jgi:hypothetical protein
MAGHGEDAIFQASCAMPECGGAFSFERDARAFELPWVLFERSILLSLRITDVLVTNCSQNRRTYATSAFGGD